MMLFILAPVVTLKTNATMKGNNIIYITEGNSISFSCDYDNVSGDQSSFYWSGRTTTQVSIWAFTVTLVTKTKCEGGCDDCFVVCFTQRAHICSNVATTLQKA